MCEKEQWTDRDCELSGNVEDTSALVVRRSILQPPKMETPLFARDMDLVREILFWAEKGGWQADAPKADDVQLAHHVRIMVDGGLIIGSAELRRIYGPRAGWSAGISDVKGLTWKGHEFLEAMRSDTAWKKIKETFAKHGVPFVTEILLKVAKSIVSDRTGLDLS